MSPHPSLFVAVLFLHSIFMQTTLSSFYHFSYSQLSWNSAELYCQQHCHSTLASIHSVYDLATVSQILANNTFATNLWIGLYTNSSDHFRWSDNSSFDYGSALIASTNNNNDYFSLNYDNSTHSFAFNNLNPSDTKQTFICNECQWKTLTKYVYVPLTAEYPRSAAAAEQKCNAMFRTSLASIHSNSDNSDVRLLSELSEDLNMGTYVGLTDTHTENVMQWTDNTTLDYWHNNLTTFANENGKDCVYLDKVTGNWRSAQCTQQNLSIVCNAMNEFCDSHTWENDDNDQGFVWGWNGNECSVYSNTNGSLSAFTIRKFLIRSYAFETILIEYTFKLDLTQPYLGTNPGEQSFAGLVVNIMDSDRANEDITPFYIGLQLMNGKIYLFLRNKDRLPEITRSNVDMTGLIDLNSDIHLGIRFENGTFFLSWNGHSDSGIMPPQFVGDQIPDSTYVRGVNVQNQKISVWNKALFYNGWTNKSVLYTDYPTPEPTAVPSLTPTQYPTTTPSKYPTQYPSVSPSRNPTTDYPTISPVTTTADPSRNPTKNTFSLGLAMLLKTPPWLKQFFLK